MSTAPTTPEVSDHVTAAITNSVIQEFAKELCRQGRGGLGDSRRLRAAVRQVVLRNLPRTINQERVRELGANT